MPRPVSSAAKSLACTLKVPTTECGLSEYIAIASPVNGVSALEAALWYTPFESVPSSS